MNYILVRYSYYKQKVTIKCIFFVSETYDIYNTEKRRAIFNDQNLTRVFRFNCHLDTR